MRKTIQKRLPAFTVVECSNLEFTTSEISSSSLHSWPQGCIAGGEVSLEVLAYVLPPLRESLAAELAVAVVAAVASAVATAAVAVAVSPAVAAPGLYYQREYPLNVA